MAHKAQFVAHFRVIPDRGKRFETVRSLMRVARLVYDGLDAEDDLVLAWPGGGQAASFGNSMNSDYEAACAVKPQFGETPAQLMITGFYAVDANNVQPHADKQVFHANAAFTGAGGAQPWLSNPVASVTTEVSALKAIIDAVITAEVPGEGVTLFRLEYKGIIFGDRGYTFP